MNFKKVYDHKKIENKIYKYWIYKNYFSSFTEKKKSYTIIMPPPNITGILHMGHILNNTIQDILIRYARMKGYNACWVPGTDHASIATEAKIVSHLKKKNIFKEKIGKKKFLNYGWKWKNKYEKIIINQIKKLGCSCDWNRKKFSMDSIINESVTKIFVKLYKEGKIYRNYSLVNWDPDAGTTISNEEIIYKKYNGKLYYIKYKIEGEKKFLTVATTRPETILADTAICINPKDKRYFNIKKKKVINPLCSKLIPIIEDDYVDMNFGTGCLKITPAHDLNDKLIADRHKISVINIFDDRAVINHNGLNFCGKDRFKARKEIIELLKKEKKILKIDKYIYNIGISERTKSIIEPKLSLQWFVKIKDFITPTLFYINNKNINLYPKNIKNIFNHWLSNIHDWNISRQLWWGHRLPVYYYNENNEDFVVSETIEEALKEARIKSNNKILSYKNLRQEKDVLDTWFSSWLWPISVFDGIRYPNNNEIKYYYPTQDLITAPDILFFWVIRMIMLGHYIMETEPFKNIYFTGIVKDKKKKKMSKSLGNSPDPIDLIYKYGADAVRVGILLSSNVGIDLIFDNNFCLKGRNLANKIWNAFLLINSIKSENVLKMKYSDELTIKWFDNKINKSLSKIEFSIKNYRISESFLIIYKLFWNDFCSYYLELIKYNSKILNKKIINKTIFFFKKILKLFHPYMPFITEYIWQFFKKNEKDLIITNWPKHYIYNNFFIKKFKKSLFFIRFLRKLRVINNIYNKKNLILIVLSENKDFLYYSLILKLGNISYIQFFKKKPKKYFSFIFEMKEFFLKKKLKNSSLEEVKKKIFFYKIFLLKINNKISHNKFLKKATLNIIKKEKKKQLDCIKNIFFLKKKKNIYLYKT
ncbi:valine--tRNA ligase [Candidatus Karelsulcia muelleri]|uniref:Valine--tRNA ligase n=1 Tax=Candidatus Karelsulcia muelleri PSPU TaxID=1189303 RepID=A0AAD1AYY5_9FLAO|nr:valine--tRNA ligase [Candidatus Karelsulcia muelleri]NJJ98785.1 valine--tRNA ligase [Candidatus Karelsulcia muelleri]BAO66186.1 valyl-tRNA synthetase [Candidatus Karelsulcia muelleri PSPU]